MSISPEPRNLFSKLVTASLLFLVAAVALTLAIDLLARIWIWLVLIGVVAGVVVAVTWLVQRRRSPW